MIKSSSVFLISDTHFDHANIIRYANRPFPDVHAMNRVLIRNWNSVVGRGDQVLFLGDLTYGRHHKPVSYWLHRLNGRKTMIKGSHDEGVHHTVKNLVVNHYGMKFFLVHDPSDVPEEWGEWKIFGHIHNKGRFIDFNRKSINVSVEQINYTPINFNWIVHLIRKHDDLDKGRNPE